MILNLRIPALALSLATACPAYSATPEQATFAPDLEIVDAPTASTLYARMFHLNFRAFRGGGIMVKALASFNNSLMLGLSLKANNVVGSGSVHFDKEPLRAAAKLRLFTFPVVRLHAAVGYDGMSYDSVRKWEGGATVYCDATRQKGLYGVLSKELGGGGLDLRAHAGAGVIRFQKRTGSSDAADYVNAFLGASAALSEDLHLGMEYDDFLKDKGSLNAAVAYSWDVGLRLELDFKSLLRGVSNHHRMLKILYTF